jgi:DNA transformation protein
MRQGSDATPVHELQNLGPASAAMLAELGITTRADLERVGPVLAYRALQDMRPGMSLNLLWAMHGALTEERWDRLSAETRERLKREVAEAADVPPHVERPHR